MSPPTPTLRGSLRRWWRARGQLSRLPYWAVFTGIPFLIALLALCCIGGATIGWWATFEVLIGLTSPKDTRVPAVALLVSIFGWLLMPAIAGGVGGYAVAAQIEPHRKRTVNEILSRLQDRQGGSG
jgi:hypothetical protein